MLRLWNTATRRLEEFVPLVSGKAGFYACGPTVYQRAHIGNLRVYVMEDLLRRVLEMQGFEVKHVMNITDVGHLTDDADAGEDKMEKASRKTGESAWEIAQRYTQQFLEDIQAMNIHRPTVMPRATDFIQEQIDLIQTLEQRGCTYRTNDGIYFDTHAFPGYGSLSGQPLEEKEEGARVEVNVEKKHPTDFALWKFSPSDGPKRQMEWSSPWGIGFPGWHVECSAMSRHELGQPFDIHAGGADHIPVHHENEIAQSVAAYGVPLARYWFHGDFLLVDGGKMSKSLHNDYSLDDVRQKGFQPLEYRYFLLGAQYRQKQNFTWEGLQAAQNALRKMRTIVREWNKPTTIALDMEAEFIAALDDDLNTPRALAVVWKLIDSEYPSDVKAATLLKMDQVLGLGLDDYVAKPIEIPAPIQSLLAKRTVARQEKNWQESDRLRDELKTLGWLVEDGSDGQKALPLA